MNILEEKFKEMNLKEKLNLKEEYDNGLTHEIISSIFISKHAFQRAKEKLGLDRREAKDVILEALRDGEYIGLTPAIDGNESHLYALNEVGVHVSTDFKAVVTIIEYSHLENISNMFACLEEIKELVLNEQKKTLKKLTKDREKLKKDIFTNKLDTDIEKAILTKKIHKSRLPHKKEEYESKLEGISHNEILEKESLEDIEVKIRALSYSIATMNTIKKRKKA